MKDANGFYIGDQFVQGKSKKEKEQEYMEQLAHGVFTTSQKQYIDWKFEQLKEFIISRTDPRLFSNS